MDVALTRWINSPAGNHAVLDAVMIAITQFGVPAIVVCVALQWWARDGRTHVRHTAVSAGLSFLLGLAVNQAILLFIARVRPYDAGVTQLIIAPSADPSFPSDHATAAMAVVAAFFLQRLPRRALAFLVMAVLVCWSRVYVGTHYVTDVIGGALTGILAAAAVRVAFREGTRLDRFVTALL